MSYFPFGSSPDTFVATVEVRAVEMSLGNYNVMRGWTIPEDEDPKRAGYLIEDVDTKHTTWIPKEVFAERYTKKVPRVSLDTEYPYG